MENYIMANLCDIFRFPFILKDKISWDLYNAHGKMAENIND